MRITVVNGERSVVVQVKGNSPAKMKEAEAMAARLLTLGPEDTPRPPIGFAAARKEDAPDGGSDADE